MIKFTEWLEIREGKTDKIKANVNDLRSYGKGVAYGAAAGLAGTLAGGPLLGVPLGWLTARAVSKRDYEDRNFKKKKD